MTIPCPGCGEDLTSIEPALSRFGHGDICSDCGVNEAFSGNFITRYSAFPMEYPAAYLKDEVRLKCK